MPVDVAGEMDSAPAARLPRRSGDSLAALQRHFVLIGLLLLLSIAGLAAWEAQRIERDRIAEFRQDMLHLSEVLDETLNRQLHSLDSALLLLRAEYVDHKADMGRMLALLRQGPLRDVDVFLTVLDKEGRVVFSDVPGAGDAFEPQDLAHLRELVGEGADRLRISEMAKGSPSKRWGLQLARPVLGKDGAAQGSIVLLLGPEQLTRFVQPMGMA